MNKNFRKWLACAIAITIAVYNAPYSVEALEVIKDSVQVDSDASSEGDASKPEDNGVQNSDVPQSEEENLENTIEQNNNTDSLTQAGAFWVSGEEGTDWTFSDNGELKISKDAINNIRIEGNGIETKNRILIEAGYQGTITIKNLNIDSKDNWSRAFEVQTNDDTNTNVELILEGTNTLKSGYKNPGLKFIGKGNESLLTISGKGTLTAKGGNDGAGIGGGDKENGSNITISGGRITAIGGNDGAGIGGGYNGGNGNNITISGGIVTATGGYRGAGIGGGAYGTGNNITISGGSVKVSSISVTPKDENGNPVYLAYIGEQENVTSVNVDGKDYNVSQPNDDNALYLYMTIGTHIITTNEASYEAKVYGDKPAEIKEIDIISIDNTSLDFRVKNEGYNTENLSQNITITNKGSKKATFKEVTGVEKYNVTLPANKEIEPGQTATITITPKENLSFGEHNETITIETVRGATVEVGAKFKVNEVLTASLSAKDTSIIEGKSTTLTTNVAGGSGKYGYKWYVNEKVDELLKGNEVRVSPNETTTYKVEVSDGIETKTATVVVNVIPATYTIEVDKDTLNFKTLNKGYEVNGLSENIEITNKGNSKVTLKDLTSTNYDIALPKDKELDSNNSAVITITPKKGLDVGEHNEVIIISTEQGSSATVSANFTVNEDLSVSLESEKDSIIQHQSTKLTAKVIGGSKNYTYKWYVNGVEDASLNGNEVRVSPNEKTTYKVEVSDGIETKTATVTVNVIPATYTIEVNKGTLNFGVLNQGYEASPQGETVEITNNGNSKVTLKDSQNINYDIKLPENKEIDPNNSATITITPKKGLVAGEHNEVITIATEQGSSAIVSASFKVNEALTVSLPEKTSIIEGQSANLIANVAGGSGAYRYKWYVNDNEDTSLTGNEVTVSPNKTTTYKVEVSDGIETKIAIVTVDVIPATYTIKAEPQSLDFGGKEEGYKVENLSKNVKITNTGNSKVTLKDLTNTKYDIKLPENKALDPNNSVTIKITPKKDLTVGEHNETIIIETNQGTSTTVNAKFKVNSTYVPPKPEEKPEEKPGIGVEVEVVDKIAGETRYDTSVDISQKVYPSKSEKVYLVSGEKFPDALSSAALTGKGDGPILLINDKNIDKILAEINRLGAKEIVFVGGNSISDSNKEKVEKFAKENSSVFDAFVGEDRYETAVKVAEQTIAKYGNKGKVIIADGRNYPDAVSIASYAAKEGIPVILVNGNKVPDVVKNFLNKYKIKSAIIVGGDKAVGKDVEKLFKSVDRVAGADRYDTSKKIAEKFFAGSKTVFVASGESFADSLSVSYYAGAKNAPILLTKSNSLDNDTKEYLEKNKNKDYIIVGGDKAINPDLFK